MSRKRRPAIIVGNWKMHKIIGETEMFIRLLKPHVSHTQSSVCLAVPFTALRSAYEASKESNISIGAQNMYDALQGAFTGEISGEMIRDAGGRFVILGHSERRYIFGEGNSFINRKIRRAFEIGLQPILCIGE